MSSGLKAILDKLSAEIGLNGENEDRLMTNSVVKTFMVKGDLVHLTWENPITGMGDVIKVESSDFWRIVTKSRSICEESGQNLA